MFEIEEFPVQRKMELTWGSGGRDEYRIRAQNLPVPVPSMPPIELYIGSENSYDDHVLLNMDEFSELVDRLVELRDHWKGGGA